MHKPIQQQLKVVFLIGMMGMGCPLLYAQPGTWTWMNGDSIPNQSGNYGIQGVPSPTNNPPSLYEPCEWTDLNGNFWLFGGLTFPLGIPQYHGDLWKYDPLINQWTWVKGTGIVGNPGSYGTMGIPSLTNLPPALGYGVPAWVDLNGDFWMYGGYPSVPSGPENDLWKYNIASNTWTWMHGSASANQPPVFGTLGIPDPLNTPGSRSELNATWVDNNNNLWLFGGTTAGVGITNDLWKYNPLINQWTWIKGANFANQAGVYGIKGIPGAGNVPGARWAYCHWKDANGNFWLFGGRTGFPSYATFNDMWMFNPNTNNWTWMSGTNVTDDNGNYGTQCILSITNCPPARYENRSFWTDGQGNFWMYGGTRDITAQTRYSDLWMFNPNSLEWTFVSGDTLSNQNPVYGTKGIPSASNKPGCRLGSIGWYDNAGFLFLFGGGVGVTPTSMITENDIWRYEIDSNCPQFTLAAPMVNLMSTDTTFCEKHCIGFYDLSTNNPTSWQWFFPGADSTSSTLQNPTNICYNNYGSFDVTLIACNAAGCDTLIYYNFINEYPTPVPVITQLNDTLFSSYGFSYQWWSVGNGIIAGATNNYFVPTQAGDYYVMITDSIGCEGASNTIIITGISQWSMVNCQLSIIPNPNDGSFTISINEAIRKDFSLRIIDPIGQTIYKRREARGKMQNAIKVNLGNASKGVYTGELITDEKVYRQKFIVE